MISDYLLGAIVLSVVFVAAFVVSYFLVGRTCLVDLRIGGIDE